MEQQKKTGHVMGNNINGEPMSEETFGAQKLFDDSADASKMDYYSIAHRFKEKVTKQPTILVGGTLKDYQIKGLQWMVSLYNNKLNGIFADEMVHFSTLFFCGLILYLPY